MDLFLLGFFYSQVAFWKENGLYVKYSRRDFFWGLV